MHAQICTLCKIRIYAGYVKYAFCAYIYLFTFARFKKDGVAKDIRIFSTGFLHLIDKLFWKIPFTTPSKLRKSVSNSRSLTMCWMQTVTGSRYLRNTMGTAPATNCNLGWKKWLAQHANVISVADIAVEVPSMEDCVAACYVIEDQCTAGLLLQPPAAAVTGSGPISSLP